MRHVKPLPSVETIAKYLRYCPNVGDLVWKEGNKYSLQRATGRRAGTLSKGGYLRTTIERAMYANHRVIWKLLHGAEPIGVVDHIDGDKLNNRIENLRDVTQSENLCNSVRRSDNTTGIKGVVNNKRSRWFVVNLKMKGRKIRSPRFASADDAERFLIVARNNLHGEYACHGKRHS